MIFSNSAFFVASTPSLAAIFFFALSNTTAFSAISSVASLICFSASFTSSCCISISLLIASNSLLFFTLALCLSYFLTRASASLIAALRCSINSVTPFISSSIRVWRECKPVISSSRSATSIGNSPFRI